VQKSSEASLRLAGKPGVSITFASLVQKSSIMQKTKALTALTDNGFFVHNDVQKLGVFGLPGLGRLW
jgi:hypothetical protein